MLTKRIHFPAFYSNKITILIVHNRIHFAGNLFIKILIKFLNKQI